MPRTLFDQTLAPARKNRRPFGTVTLSVMLHAAALVVVLALQFTSSIDGLIVASSTPVFVVPPKLPPPPVVTTPPVPVRRVVTPTPAPTITVTAPTVPPDDFTKSTSITPAGPPVPAGPIVGPIGTGLGPLVQTGPGIPMEKPPVPGPLRIGGSILPPTRLVYVPPVYPSMAQTARIEGEVALEATIDEKGVVQNLVVRQSVPLLDRAAMDAVARWRYSPTLLNGQPVSVIMLVRVKFTLK